MITDQREVENFYLQWSEVPIDEMRTLSELATRLYTLYSYATIIVTTTTHHHRSDNSCTNSQFAIM